MERVTANSRISTRDGMCLEIGRAAEVWTLFRNHIKTRRWSKPALLQSNEHEGSPRDRVLGKGCARHQHGWGQGGPSRRVVERRAQPMWSRQ